MPETVLGRKANSKMWPNRARTLVTKVPTHPTRGRTDGRRRGRDVLPELSARAQHSHRAALPGPTERVPAQKPRGRAGVAPRREQRISHQPWGGGFLLPARRALEAPTHPGKEPACLRGGVALGVLSDVCLCAAGSHGPAPVRLGTWEFGYLSTHEPAGGLRLRGQIQLGVRMAFPGEG